MSERSSSVSGGDRAIAGGSLAVLAAAAIWGVWSGDPGGASRGTVAAVLAVALALASAFVARPPARALAALAACLVVAARTGWPWQLVMAIALGAFGLLVRGAPSLAPSAAWRAKGNVPLPATAFVGGVTPFALTAWLFVARPNLGDVLRGYVPAFPLPVLVVGGVLFAFVNAVLEEIVWRGILQDRLEPLFGVRAAIAIQAASFGIMHAHGFPRGATGVVLVVVWGVMLGVLRKRSGGLVAPIAAHAVADATIAVLVLAFVRQ